MVATPAIVNRIIGTFKRLAPELATQARAGSGGELVEVLFEAHGYLVSASFHRAQGVFVKLTASPIAEPTLGEPAVVYVITPPDGSHW